MKQETPAERLSRKAELRRAYINRGCVCVEFESEGKIITWEPDPDTVYDLTVRFAGSICEPDTDRALKIFDELEAARSAAVERKEDCAVTPAGSGTVENSPETEGMTDFSALGHAGLSELLSHRNRFAEACSLALGLTDPESPDYDALKALADWPHGADKHDWPSVLPRALRLLGYVTEKSVHRLYLENLYEASVCARSAAGEKVSLNPVRQALYTLADAALAAAERTAEDSLSSLQAACITDGLAAALTDTVKRLSGQVPEDAEVRPEDFRIRVRALADLLFAETGTARSSDPLATDRIARQLAGSVMAFTDSVYRCAGAV